MFDTQLFNYLDCKQRRRFDVPHQQTSLGDNLKVAIQNNKLLRSKIQLRAKNKAVGESQATPDEQLTRLEDDIRRLKVEFDVYFNGASKRPPYDTKGRVETLLKRLADDRSLTFAQRYRYNTLAARYNSFRDLWRRTLQGREEGRDAASAARASAKGNESYTDPVSFVCADAHRELEIVKNLYESLLEAKRCCGEATEDISFPKFHRLVASKADAIKQQASCDKVTFSVAVEDGHVSFKAKPD